MLRGIPACVVVWTHVVALITIGYCIIEVLKTLLVDRLGWSFATPNDHLAFIPSRNGPSAVNHRWCIVCYDIDNSAAAKECRGSCCCG